MSHATRDSDKDRTRRIHPIVRDFLSLAGSRYLGILAGILRSILIPKFLMPGAYGVLKTYQIIVQLSRIIALGIPSAISRELPLAIKRREEQRRTALLNNGFWATIISVCPPAMAFLVGGAMGWISFEDIEVRWWFVLFIPLLFVDRTKIYFTQILAGQKQFVLWSKIRLVDELLTTAICVSAAYYFGFKGLVAAMLLVNTAIVAACWVGSRFRLERRGDLSLGKEMFSVGFPFLVNGLGFTVYNQVNRWVILGAYGISAVGFFSIGTTIAEQVVGMGQTMGRVLLPRMMEASGTEENPRDIRRYFFAPSRLSAMLFAPAVMMGMILLEIVFVLILPRYSEGFLPAKILLIGVYFMVIFASISPFFLAVKKQWRLTGIFLVTIPVAFLFNMVAVRMQLGLPGIALATALTDFGFVTIGLLVAMEEFHSTKMRRIMEVVRTYSPLPVAVLVLWISGAIREVAGFAENPLWGPIMQSVVFAVMYGTPLALILFTTRGRLLLGIRSMHERDAEG